jgi:uncharacterized protein YndB with AHSA1/START domain
MVKVHIVFFVAKPVEQVFELISDISAYRRWAPDKSKFFIENKITSAGPIGLGTTYIDQLRWRGKSIGEIVQYQPPSKIKFQQKTYFGLPVFRSKFKYALKSRQNGTEVTHTAEAIPCGFFKLLEPILSNIVRSERERTCNAIKRALEEK